ncbi:Tudor/PWWP/MBT superfamily protein, partial [Prunus dulcis]
PCAVNPREAGKTVAASTKDEHNVRQKVSKQLQHCHLTKHSKCIDSRDGAQLDNSGSLKATKSEVEPYSGPKKRGRKPNSSKNSEEGHDHAQPNNSFSPKAVKSEVEPYSAPKKRGRKPNSLMNPAEGYDHSWIHTGRKTQKRRKSNDKGSDASPAEGRLDGKAALHLTLEKVTEPPGLEPKPEADIGASSPLPQNNPPGGTQRRRGRPKKQVVADHSANRGPLFAARREFSNRTFEAKARRHPRALERAEKTNEECLLASIPVVTDTEAAIPFDPDEKPQQQSALDVAYGSTNDQSYVRTGTKTRRGNATSSKESTEASGSKKISKSATKLSEDNEGTHKLVLKRKCTIEKEEVSQMPDLDEQLVGSRIRVWWPMDKAFYEGVVSSYDPAKKKHLVQMENLPKPEASSDTISRRGVSAGISIVECMKSGSKSADCSTLGELKVINGEEDDQSKENDRLKDDGQVSAGKLEAETKTGIDSAQIAPETMTSSKGESPKLDIEPSGGECAKELKELSNHPIRG